MKKIILIICVGLMSTIVFLGFANKGTNKIDSNTNKYPDVVSPAAYPGTAPKPTIADAAKGKTSIKFKIRGFDANDTLILKDYEIKGHLKGDGFNHTQRWDQNNGPIGYGSVNNGVVKFYMQIKAIYVPDRSMESNVYTVEVDKIKYDQLGNNNMIYIHFMDHIKALDDSNKSGGTIIIGAGHPFDPKH